MAKFRIDLDKAYDKAAEMDGQAYSLQLQINALITLQAEMRSKWVGPASTLFQGKISTLISDMTSTKSDMTSLAAKIREIALQIQREDERLAAEAEKKL